jgi:hypothetical protein
LIFLPGNFLSETKSSSFSEEKEPKRLFITWDNRISKSRLEGDKSFLRHFFFKKSGCFAWSWRSIWTRKNGHNNAFGKSLGNTRFLGDIFFTVKACGSASLAAC